MSRIDVFVYGTLRLGGVFHDRYCRGVRSIEPAIVRGRLEHLPAGYPRLIVRPEDVLARGTAEPLRDVALQDEWRGRLVGEPEPDGAIDEEIEGDVLGFDDPELRLPRLDALEDFRASGGGLYDRVLLRVRSTATGCIVPAWVYVAPR